MIRDSVGGAVTRLSREVERTRFRVQNGIKHVAGINFAQSGPTPRTQVWSRDKVRLFRYHRAEPGGERRPVPILLIMSLVTTSIVFDLQAGNSMVQRLLDDGYDVFLLDWGTPDAVESQNTLETYCEEYLPRAVRATIDVSGADSLTLFGYCLGGVLSLLAAAGDPDLPLHNIILLATPVDMSELGPLTSMVRDGRTDVDNLLDETGNLPASSLLEAFRMVEPGGEITTYLSLWNSLDDPDRLAAHQALVRWSSGHIPFPGATLRQVVELFVRDDALVRGRIPLGSRTVDLASITVPVLHVTGTTDKLIPAASSEPLRLPNADVELLELNAGHAGMILGRKAHRETIPAMLAWLGAQQPTQEARQADG